MANTKISQLPSYSGTAADLRFFVMNNSGETETTKFSGYTSQLVPGTAANSYRTINATAASGVSSIAIGNGASATQTKSIAIGDTVSNTGAGSVNIGYSNNVVSVDSVVIGRGSNINTGGFNQVVIGTLAQSTQESGIAIGVFTNANQINGIAIGNGASGYCSIGVNANSSNAGIAIGGFNTATAAASISIGYSAGVVSSSPYGSKFGGESNTLSSTGSYNHMNNGKNNTISGTVSYSNIFNGSGNTVGSAFSGVSMLSCFGRTADGSNTTYTENLHTFRTPSTRVQSVVSGTTFTCNLDNGAKSQFYLTGASTINITNVRDGASFMIKTQTDGTHSLTWTATGGYTFLFDDGGNSPGNNVIDIFNFDVFGSVIYGSRRHNFT